MCETYSPTYNSSYNGNCKCDPPLIPFQGMSSFYLFFGENSVAYNERFETAKEQEHPYSCGVQTCKDHNRRTRVAVGRCRTTTWMKFFLDGCHRG